MQTLWLILAIEHAVAGDVDEQPAETVAAEPKAAEPPQIAMIRVEPGTFTGMGAKKKKDRCHEGPPHEVTLTRPYFVASTEVSQDLYEKVMGSNPSIPVEDEDLKVTTTNAVGAELPVQNVRWFEAIEFCNRLSELSGLAPVYDVEGGLPVLPCSPEGAPVEAAPDDCWSRYRNVFQKARALGVNVGIAGWYHPYCRIFFESVSDCTWAGLPYWNSPRIVDSLDQQWKEVLDPIPVVGDRSGPGVRTRRAHREAFVTIRAAALRISADPEIGLALLHFPVPHHPDIYDPDRGALSIDDPRSYLDNLLLADRTLGEVRAAMQARGLWEASTVIVTSDHWWRAIHRGDWGLTSEEEDLFADGANQRVPFLVKLSGEAQPSAYRKPFNTLLLHDLVLEILNQQLATAASVGTWLDDNRSRAPIAYPVRIPKRVGPAAGRSPRG